MLTVTDSNGYTGSASTTIAVADVYPTVTIGPYRRPSTPRPLEHLLGDRNEPVDHGLAGWIHVRLQLRRWLIDHDNPSASNGAGVSTTHSYAAPGTYELQVTATDDNGGIGSQLAMVTVTDPIPSVSLNAVSYTVAIGTALPVTGTASSSYAPAQAAGFTFVYSWGDGVLIRRKSGESPESGTTLLRGPWLVHAEAHGFGRYWRLQFDHGHRHRDGRSAHGHHRHPSRAGLRDRGGPHFSASAILALPPRAPRRGSHMCSIGRRVDEYHPERQPGQRRRRGRRAHLRDRWRLLIDGDRDR